MYELILFCSVVAYVYAEILVKPGEVLAPWARFIERTLVKDGTSEEGYYRKEHWLYKPIFGCAKCVSGQLALWGCIFVTDYGIIKIVCCICGSILLTKILTIILRNYD